MAKPTSTTAQFVVDIDTEDVDKLLKTLEWSISPSMLHEFLTDVVHPWLAEEAVQRFANAGDSRVGQWADLAESTNRIREQLGYAPDWPINIRTEELFLFVIEQYMAFPLADGAEMHVPGPPMNKTLEEKLRTAQLGRSASENPFVSASGRKPLTSDVNPPSRSKVTREGGSTPPRPVIGINELDAEFTLAALANWVTAAIRVGGI